MPRKQVAAKQMNLIAGTWSRDHFAFGGSLLKGSHAKSKRCFSRKLPLHVVMKSTKARGALSLYHHSSRVARILGEQAVRHRVRILGTANAGNHLHILLQAPSREQLSNFLRAVSGRIAQTIVSSQGSLAPAGNKTSFWDARPFSRLVSWGQDLHRVARYLCMNSTEMTGLSRSGVRSMFAQVHDLLRQGLIPRTPGLLAAGFV